MSGCTNQLPTVKRVRKYLAGSADLIDVINAQIPTAAGLKTADLIGAVTLYDMAFQYNLPLAKKMGAAVTAGTSV